MALFRLKPQPALSGLELLKEMVAGRLPGRRSCRRSTFGLTEIENGRAVFEGTPQMMHYNPLGTVHGGYAATLLDSMHGLRRAFDAAEGR